VKKVLITSLALLFISLSTVNACEKKAHNHGDKMATMFQSVSPNEAVILQKGKNKEACPLCGMNLVKFYKTTHSAVVNGVQKQYCSIHCLYDDKTLRGGEVKDIKVVAVDTLQPIDVKNATYVVGSKIRGTMSMTSQYAFLDKAKAVEFQKENGGDLMNFDQAYSVASKDFK